MYKQTSILTTGAMLVAAIVTVALYNVSIANAQANMTVPYKEYPPNATERD
jgi:hypothetical protein